MARSIRIQFAGATYHVMCRGDRREKIFHDAQDRTLFLTTLAEACDRAGFRIHAYVLMSNHYHLLLETPEPNLVDGMRWFQGTYTVRFNARRRLCGHLFQGRYKAIPMDTEEPENFRIVSDYIHLNPARAHLLNAEKPDLRAYPWSSYPLFVDSGRLPDWLVRRRVFEAQGLAGEGSASRRKYQAHAQRLATDVMAGKASDERADEWQPLRRGWYLGGEQFRDRLLDMAAAAAAGKRRSSFEACSMSHHDAAAAQRRLQEGLAKLDVTRAWLVARRANDPVKQAVAWWVATGTTTKGDWICTALGRGHRSNVSRAVASYRNPEDRDRQKLKKALLQPCKD